MQTLGRFRKTEMEVGEGRVGRKRNHELQYVRRGDRTRTGTVVLLYTVSTPKSVDEESGKSLNRE